MKYFLTIFILLFSHSSWGNELSSIYYPKASGKGIICSCDKKYNHCPVETKNIMSFLFGNNEVKKEYISFNDQNEIFDIQNFIINNEISAEYGVYEDKIVWYWNGHNIEKHELYTYAFSFIHALC